VIGAGLGGLCAAGLLAKYGNRYALSPPRTPFSAVLCCPLSPVTGCWCARNTPLSPRLSSPPPSPGRVLVCESHSIAGGAAHAFVRRGFHFDSGPSFHAGLSLEHSVNPSSRSQPRPYTHAPLFRLSHHAPVSLCHTVTVMLCRSAATTVALPPSVPLLAKTAPCAHFHPWIRWPPCSCALVCWVYHRCHPLCYTHPPCLCPLCVLKVLERLDETVPCVQYKSWIGYFPGGASSPSRPMRRRTGDEILRVGGQVRVQYTRGMPLCNRWHPLIAHCTVYQGRHSQYASCLCVLCVQEALDQWLALETLMAPVAAAAVAIPAAALRQDAWNVLTVSRFLPGCSPCSPLWGPAAALLGATGQGEFTLSPPLPLFLSLFLYPSSSLSLPFSPSSSLPSA